MYGFETDYPVKIEKNGWRSHRLRFLLTAQDSESKKFTYNNIERIAFRMNKTALGFYAPKPATVSSKKLYPKAEDNIELNIYIQSHVLHRFKERTDIFTSNDQNTLLHITFTDQLHLKHFENQVLFPCWLTENVAIGYFTFFIRGGDIVINTFLPVTSPNMAISGKVYQAIRSKVYQAIRLKVYQAFRPKCTSFIHVEIFVQIY